MYKGAISQSITVGLILVALSGCTPKSIDNIESYTENESKTDIKPAVKLVNYEPIAETGGFEEPPFAFIAVNKQSNYTRNENDAFYIYGETSDNCNKINVEAKNEIAGLYDTYDLRNYEKGDTFFKYGVRADWNNLAAGTTVYTFKAYCEGYQVKQDFAIIKYNIQASQPINTATPKQDTFDNKAVTNQPKEKSCDPNYSGCVPVASDVDCAGGSGNGPAYVMGPVMVIGRDIYGLDRDKDGWGCE